MGHGLDLAKCREQILRASRGGYDIHVVLDILAPELCDEIDILRAENERLRGLISDTEWSPCQDWHECLHCDAVQESGNGHRDDCPIVDIVRDGK